MNIDPILKEQFDKVNPVKHQRIHHSLLQRVDLREHNKTDELLFTHYNLHYIILN